VETPKWNDPNLKAGTMSRSALWLIQVVGEGNIFNKEQVRKAFPGISQADRRIRDLRKFGWLIDANTSDGSLASDQQRFVSRGIAVWEPGQRPAGTIESVTAKQRAATFAADGFQCVLCGIAGGETYLDDLNQSAVLVVTRRQTILLDGSSETQLVTECKRCRAGFGHQAVDLRDLSVVVASLDPNDRARLARWIARGRRGSTELDRAWSSIRRLPHESRVAMAQEVVASNN
jgi:hypothetical protein